MTRLFNSTGHNASFLAAGSGRSRYRNTSKLSGILAGLTTFFLVSIWVFTPLSEEAHYKPELQTISNTIPDPVKTSTPPEQIETTTQRRETPKQAPMEGYRLSPSPLNSLSATETGHPDGGINTLAGEAQTDAGISTEGTPSPDSSSTITAHAQAGPSSGHVKAYKIKPGDSLTKIFAEADLPTSQAIKLAKIEEAKKLNSLSVGHALRIYFDQNEQWETLEYDYDKLNTLIITANDGELRVTNHTKRVEYREFTAKGVIQTSLGYAAEKAGMPEKLAYSLVDVYKWEIDFARDLHKGDSFSVVYQKAYVDNEYIDSSIILAASFTTGGETIEAVRYTDSQGITQYFQPNGESLRRGFLRTPVKLARITSGFGGRQHPIQKTWKQHKGVDYGAKRGTPVLSTADGVVQYAGKKGGYGNTIILRHGGIYTTLYAHLSKLGKGVRTGKPVEQGQVIGYVGHTGWATGDHLHYEFRVEGMHKNPLKVDLPKTLPLAKKEIKSFTLHAEPLLATLASLKGTSVADIQTLNNRRDLY